MKRLSAQALQLPFSLAPRSDDPALLPREDLTVQVHHDDGCWHRRAIGGSTTACGLDLPEKDRHALRLETYGGHICRAGCFSPYEVRENGKWWARNLAK